MREMLIAVLTNAVWLSTPVVGIAQDQTQIARGIQVYAEQKCAVCHSIARLINMPNMLLLGYVWRPYTANRVWGRISYFW